MNHHQNLHQNHMLHPHLPPPHTNPNQRTTSTLIPLTGSSMPSSATSPNILSSHIQQNAYSPYSSYIPLPPSSHISFYDNSFSSSTANPNPARPTSFIYDVVYHTSNPTSIVSNGNQIISNTLLQTPNIISNTLLTTSSLNPSPSVHTNHNMISNHQGNIQQKYMKLEPAAASYNIGSPTERPIPAAVTGGMGMIQDWLRANFEENGESSIARHVVYEMYVAYCTKVGIEPVNPASFGKIIRSVFVKIKTRRLGMRGNSKYHYNGIRIRENSTLALPSSSSLSPRSPINMNNNTNYTTYNYNGLNTVNGSNNLNNNSNAIRSIAQINRGTNNDEDSSPPPAKRAKTSKNSSSSKRASPPSSPPLPIQTSTSTLANSATSTPTIPISSSSNTSPNSSTMPPSSKSMGLLLSNHSNYKTTDTSPTSSSNSLISSAPSPSNPFKRIILPSFHTPISPLPLYPSTTTPLSKLQIQEVQSQYHSHCQHLLDLTVSSSFSEIPLFLSRFYQQMPPSNKILYSHPLITSFIYDKDLLISSIILHILIPDVFSSTNYKFADLQNFTKNYTHWVWEAVKEGFGREFVEIKVGVAKMMCEKICKQMTLNHLVQVTRTVFSNHGNEAKMLIDWDTIDFDFINLELSRAIGHDFSFLLTNQGNGNEKMKEIWRGFIISKSTVEQWIQWIHDMAENWFTNFMNSLPSRNQNINSNNQNNSGNNSNSNDGNGGNLGQGITEEEKEYIKRAMEEMIMRWGYYESLIMSDLTIRNAPSFGSFHLLRTLFDEYLMFWSDERKKTLDLFIPSSSSTNNPSLIPNSNPSIPNGNQNGNHDNPASQESISVRIDSGSMIQDDGKQNTDSLSQNNTNHQDNNHNTSLNDGSSNNEDNTNINTDDGNNNHHPNLNDGSNHNEVVEIGNRTGSAVIPLFWDIDSNGSLSISNPSVDFSALFNGMNPNITLNPSASSNGSNTNLNNTNNNHNTTNGETNQGPGLFGGGSIDGGGTFLRKPSVGGYFHNDLKWMMRGGSFDRGSVSFGDFDVDDGSPNDEK